MASGLQAEDFFDEAEDITDISIPSGIKENEELVRTFNSVDHRQLEMTLGVIDILERGEWLAQVTGELVIVPTANVYTDRSSYHSQVCIL